MSSKASPGYRWVVAIVCFLVLTIGFSYTSLWSLVIEDVMREFNISSATAQLGNSAILLGYAIGGYVLGQLTAKLGYYKTALVGLVLFVIGSIGIPLANSFALILFLRFLQGFGMIWGVAVGMASEWFPAKNRGFVAGLVGAGLPIGAGLGGRVVASLYMAFPAWRACFQMSNWAFFVIVALFLIFARNAPKNLYPEEAVDTGTARVTSGKNSDLNVWKVPAAWMCVLALFAICWVGNGFLAILPQYSYSLGYTVNDVGNAMLIMGIVGMILAPISGIVSDSLIKRGWDPAKARAWVMAIAAFLPSCIVLFTTSLAPLGLPMVYLICLCQSTCSPFGNASIGALPMDMLQDQKLADKMFGMTILVGNFLGSVLSPFAIAAVQNLAGWTVAFIVVGAAAVLGMVVGFIMPRFKLQD